MSKITVKQAQNKALAGLAVMASGVFLVPFAVAENFGAPYTTIVEMLPFKELVAIPFVAGVGMIVWGVFTAKASTPHLGE